MSSADVSSTTATLTYFVAPDNGVRAYGHINADPITGERKKNYTTEQREVVIENVRGKEGEFTLDNSGFQFVRSPAKHTSFANDEEIKNEYYPESIELYKKVTGASRVVIFDHNHQPLEAINVPALEWPLGLCDYRSVNPEKDALPVALVYPDREGETYGITYNPNHKWKYLRGMTPEEVVLIKCFDSVQDGSVAVFTPHTGFSDPTTPPDAPHRESIELRALVFYD
ncbi:hypothetical protein NMY22_g9099 [Coprinellus aureogranulatus]|nr:hypothetical protein NMY22_g9099 [Coprinellus aureogranulatus]